MLKTGQIEQLLTVVATLDRGTLSEQFKRYRASFPVDFSHDFIQSQSLEKLRHIFVAMCMQQQRMPDFITSEAA